MGWLEGSGDKVLRNSYRVHTQVIAFQFGIVFWSICNEKLLKGLFFCIENS